MANRPVGKASVKIEVEGVEQAQRQLDGVKQSVGDVGDAGREGFGKLDDAVGKVGQRIEDSTAGLRRFQGAITGIIGVVGGLAAVFGTAFIAISNNFKKADEEAKTFKESLERIREAGKEVAESFSGIAQAQGDSAEQIEDQGRRAAQALEEQFAEQLKEITSEIDKINSKGINDPLGGTDLNRLETLNTRLQQINDAIDKQQAIIRRSAEQAADRVRDSEDTAKAEADAAAAAAERATNRQLEISLLDEESQVIERLADTERRIQKEIQDAEERGQTERVKALEEQLRLETEIARVRIEGIVSANQAKQANSAGSDLVSAMRELIKAAQEQTREINENTRQLAQQRQREINFSRDIRQVARNTNRRGV
ncbi:MAG: Atg14 domain-containing protein [Epibacterium sp.]|nr:Atg14 domain-containing protein [Epibacterium sp.]NQX75358.1 hypothetical protein [Epibacterium sp.]